MMMRRKYCSFKSKPICRICSMGSFSYNEGQVYLPYTVTMATIFFIRVLCNTPNILCFIKSSTKEHFLLVCGILLCSHLPYGSERGTLTNCSNVALWPGNKYIPQLSFQYFNMRDNRQNVRSLWITLIT